MRRMAFKDTAAVKEILMALGGESRLKSAGAYNVSRLSNAVQFYLRRAQLPDFVRVFRQPKGTYGVEFWQASGRILLERKGGLVPSELKRVVSDGAKIRL